MSRYQKGKTNLDFTEARDSEWQWHQLGHIQVCISLQTDNHVSTSPLSFLQAGCPSCRPTNSVKALKAIQRWSVSVYTVHGQWSPQPRRRRLGRFNRSAASRFCPADTDHTICIHCISAGSGCIYALHECKRCAAQGSGLTIHRVVKVKFSHTRYRALGPELILVYRQSARR